ncbi:PCRF domain-containing protein, partial [Candidatus Saccharibacteria bacterium]|nr:PCRF domain-containing protein [Candidatus Saccharibacteria bacterium]
MEDLQRRADELKKSVIDALGRIGYEKLLGQKQELDAQVAEPDFWQDSDTAQKISKEQADLDKRLQPWTELKHQIDEALELIGLGDDAMK